MKQGLLYLLHLHPYLNVTIDSFSFPLEVAFVFFHGYVQKGKDNCVVHKQLHALET